MPAYVYTRTSTHANKKKTKNAKLNEQSSGSSLVKLQIVLTHPGWTALPRILWCVFNLFAAPNIRGTSLCKNANIKEVQTWKELDIDRHISSVIPHHSPASFGRAWMTEFGIYSDFLLLKSSPPKPLCQYSCYLFPCLVTALRGEMFVFIHTKCFCLFVGCLNKNSN